MFETFTKDARQVVVQAQEQARRLNHNYIGTEHLLLGVVYLPSDDAASRVLRRLGFNPDAVRVAVEQIIGRGTETPSGSIPFTPRCKKVLELSQREALRLRSDSIGPEHMVLGMLREGLGVAAQVLARLGPPFDEIRAAVLDAAGSPPDTAASEAGRTPAAEQVLSFAEQLAAGGPIGSHHLLEALARADASMAGKALAGLGVSPDAVTGQVDALDLADTTDVTPEQAAAAQLRWTVVRDQATLVSTDPATVDRLRQILDRAGGELAGDGPLAGPFVALHRAIQLALDAFAVALDPEGPPDPADDPPTTLRDRLRRRRP